MSKQSGMESVRHELLSDVADHTTAILVEHGIDEGLADQVGCAISNHLAESWGGQNLTVPKDYLYRLSERDMMIYKEFNGRNHSALSRKYHVSVRAIYKIIKRTHKRVIDKTQISLF